MKNVALLLLRLTLGSLLARHGAQKLFWAFGGPGLDGTTGWLASQGFRPARPWALLAGLGEFGGGVLTGLGFLNPLGPLGVFGAMTMAAAKFHAGKPIWAQQGGAELPLTNIGIATAVALAGPGQYSLDEALGIRIPRWLALPGALGAAAVVGYGLYTSNQNMQEQAAQPAAASDEDRAAATPVPAQPEERDTEIERAASLSEVLADASASPS
jgi:putative oxidoreductase